MHGYAVVLMIFSLFVPSALCAFTSVSFSMIEQCGSLQVNYSATRTPDFPLTLTIVPFFSRPIYIPIQFSSWDNSSSSGSARVTFLPYETGMQFVASLESADGTESSLVSDVLAVQPSNNTSCLPIVTGDPFLNAIKGSFYMIHGLLNQCSHFNVSFDPNVVDHPPTIRAFVPRNTTYFVNASDTPPVTVTMTVHGNSSGPFGIPPGGGGGFFNGSSSDYVTGANGTNLTIGFFNSRSLSARTSSKGNSDSNGDDKDNQDGKDDNKGDDSDSDSGSDNGNDDSHHSSSSGDGNGGGSGSTNNGNSNGSNNSNNTHKITVTLQEYVLDIVHGSQAVLLLDDGAGHQQTSMLFTAGGNTGSSSVCVKELNLGTSSSETSSSRSSKSREFNPLSRTAKLIIGVLGGCILVILMVVAFLLYKFRVFKRPKWLSRQSRVKTFVFTEDVDMGSSFVSRVRGRFSQLWATSASVITGRRSPWSLRSERATHQDKEQRSSYGLLTSPRISLAPSTVRTPSASHAEDEKTQSWTYFMNEYLDLTKNQPSDLEKRISSGEGERVVIVPKYPSLMAVMSKVPLPAAAHLRTPNPDAPVPAITSSRIIFGSGYLSSRSSRMTTSTAIQSAIRSSLRPTSNFFSPKVRRGPDGERVSFSNASSSGYMSSRSSSALPESPPASDDEVPCPISTIYVSPAIAPVNDVDLLARSIGLGLEGSRKDPGRIPPFPTTSQRSPGYLD